MITQIKLSKILYDYDTMGTHCIFYKSYKEYDAEAKEILKLVSSGVPFKYAYISVMTHFFWEDWVLNSMDTFKFIELEYYNHRG